MGIKLPIDRGQIEAFCHKWQITELSLFGSVLRDDFGPQSDVDVLVTFAPEAHWSLYDFSPMREELIAIVGRDVDLVEKRGLRNPFRRHHILTHREIIYAA